MFGFTPIHHIYNNTSLYLSSPTKPIFAANFYSGCPTSLTFMASLPDTPWSYVAFYLRVRCNASRSSKAPEVFPHALGQRWTLQLFANSAGSSPSSPGKFFARGNQIFFGATRGLQASYESLESSCGFNSTGLS